MGNVLGFRRREISPFEIPDILQDEDSWLEVAHRYKIPIHDALPIASSRTISKQYANTPVEIFARTDTFPVYDDHRTCLIVWKKNLHRRVSCAGVSIETLARTINENRDNYNHCFVLYSEREGQRYFTCIRCGSESGTDTFVILWARRILYADTTSSHAEHVPIILRQYSDTPEQFDVFICQPKQCIILRQRNIVIHGI